MAKVTEDHTMFLSYHHSTTAATVPIRALQDTWVILLRRWVWQRFCTFTFRDIIHSESADKRFRLFISMVNRECYGACRPEKEGA
jgi:hypothetical protein